MGMLDIINAFVETMIDERAQFESLKCEVEQHEAKISEVIRNLDEREIEIVKSAQSKMQGLSEKNVLAIFDHSAQFLQAGVSGANASIQEAIKAMEFIRAFESHFTVSVFGKVKAGKSYIGNFVMGRSLKKYNIPSSYDSLGKISVNVYDRGQQTESDKLNVLDEEDDSFGVAAREATSTIQWFDIGALSWFDTPGIGSVTKANEMLAKEYVKNSDLVIFACNSDAAGTVQEFLELQQLHGMGKPILLLLTQSDVYEYDIDDNGDEISVLLPKSDKDRVDTEQYIIQSLEEKGMSELLRYELLTVSAKLADAALHAGDEAMFEQSNMGLLLQKLIEITKNDAAAMKKQTPRNRVNEMIDSIIKRLEDMNCQIAEACRSIDESRNDLEQRQDWIFEQVKARVNLKVLGIVSRFKKQIEAGEDVVTEDILSSEIEKAVSETLSEVLNEEAIRVSSGIDKRSISLSGIGEMHMRRESIAYETSYVVDIERDPRGVIEKIGSFFGKTYYSHELRTKTAYSNFDIGVNDTEITQNITFQLEEVFRTGVAAFIEDMVGGYYRPIEELQIRTSNEIAEAIQKLNALRM